MSIQILMPALSPTMTEGAVARWLKKEGDEIHSGDVIAEIETDKATMEYEAVDEGRLGKIIVPEGTQGVQVNQPIAILLEEGEDASAIGNAVAAPASGEAKPASNGGAAAPHPSPLPAGGEGEGRVSNERSRPCRHLTAPRRKPGPIFPLPERSTSGSRLSPGSGKDTKIAAIGR
jgi:pyruvate/2-oxoglutarate dehydrogenase complex dihydrolipoamide acyltransferase (E2) component